MSDSHRIRIFSNLLLRDGFVNTLDARCRILLFDLDNVPTDYIEMNECTKCKNIFLDHDYIMNNCSSYNCNTTYCDACSKKYLNTQHCYSCEKRCTKPLCEDCFSTVSSSTYHCKQCLEECCICGVQQRADLSKKMICLYDDDEHLGYKNVHKECRSALL